jgi:hypothetical protein
MGVRSETAALFPWVMACEIIDGAAHSDKVRTIACSPPPACAL